MKSVQWFCDLCKNEIRENRHVVRLTGPDLKTIQTWDLCLTCTENLLGGAAVTFPLPLQEGEEEVVR
jgi:hypothetical protein